MPRSNGAGEELRPWRKELAECFGRAITAAAAAATTAAGTTAAAAAATATAEPTESAEERAADVAALAGDALEHGEHLESAGRIVTCALEEAERVQAATAACKALGRDALEDAAARVRLDAREEHVPARADHAEPTCNGPRIAAACVRSRIRFIGRCSVDDDLWLDRSIGRHRRRLVERPAAAASSERGHERCASEGEPGGEARE